MRRLFGHAMLATPLVLLAAFAMACGGGGGSGSEGGQAASDGAASAGDAARERVATSQAQQTATAKGQADARATMVAATAAVTQPSAALEITAKDIKFDKAVLVAPANTRVAVKLINAETTQAERHNFALFRKEGLQEPIFVGELEGGSVTREYSFTTPGPGTYFFLCSPHPSDMFGAFVVK